MNQPAGANISSVALEQQEVNTIATELKHQLNKPGQKQEADDTIAIDQDGTLHVRDQP
jgi:hypothetical protein